MQQSATDDTIAWPPGGDVLRRSENQRMLSSCSLDCHFRPLAYTTLDSLFADFLNNQNRAKNLYITFSCI